MTIPIAAPASPRRKVIRINGSIGRNSKGIPTWANTSKVTLKVSAISPAISIRLRLSVNRTRLEIGPPRRA